MLYDDKGYSIEGNIRRARYKLAMSRRLSHDAAEEARALCSGAEGHAWLRIAQTARQDSRYWIQELRRASELVGA